jgi:hypothetical protein
MSSNLFQIVETSELIHFLQKSEQDSTFLVLTLVISETPDITKKKLRKYIKQKAIEYPDRSFIYYIVPKHELGKIKNILESDKELYPLLFHIYDKKILIRAESITVSKMNLLDESFDQINDSIKNVEQTIQNLKNDEQDEKCSQESSKEKLIIEQPKIFDPILHKKKYIEKINFLKQKTDEMKLELYKEIGLRKKIQEKNSKKK